MDSTIPKAISSTPMPWGSSKRPPVRASNHSGSSAGRANRNLIFSFPAISIGKCKNSATANDASIYPSGRLSQVLPFVVLSSELGELSTPGFCVSDEIGDLFIGLDRIVVKQEVGTARNLAHLTLLCR